MFVLVNIWNYIVEKSDRAVEEVVKEMCEQFTS